jgi:hypothetical protein
VILILLAGFNVLEPGFERRLVAKVDVKPSEELSVGHDGSVEGLSLPQLLLIPFLSPAQVGFAQVGMAQFGTGQVGVVQNGVAQIGMVQVGAAQGGKVQSGTAQVGLSEIKNRSLVISPDSYKN